MQFPFAPLARPAPMVRSARSSFLLPAAVLLAACAAPAARADLVGTAAGSVTVGGGANAFRPPTTGVPVGPAEEFAGEVFNNSIFGTNSADAFADLSAGRIEVGFRRTAGTSGISVGAPVVFDFTNLTFSEPISGLTVTNGQGTTSRPVATDFTQNSVTVRFADGFILTSGEAAQSIFVNFQTAPVPEPGTVLLTLGAAAAALLRRRFAA